MSHSTQLPDRPGNQLPQRGPYAYALAALVVAGVSAFIGLTHIDEHFASVCMLYLLGVMFTALFCGSLPAVFSSILAFASSDYLFIEPKFTLAVKDPSEWIALCVFLLVATLTGQLTALLRIRAQEARQRELEAAALAEASWSVVSQLDGDQALSMVLQQLVRVVEGVQKASLFRRDEQGGSQEVACYLLPGSQATPDLSQEALCRVSDSGLSLDWSESPHDSSKCGVDGGVQPVYLPISMENQILGVLYLELDKAKPISTNKQRIVDSLLNYAAVVMQRDKLIQIKSEAQALAQANRLKTTILSMVSHDFRSPLTAIKASVENLLDESRPWDPDSRRNLLQAIDEETDRINHLVGNILDLSRLQADAWRPRYEPVSLTELVGAVVDSFTKEENERIDINIEGTAQDIWVDSVQMVQVLRNLLENALKYSAATSLVEMEITQREEILLIRILDRGPGLPEGEEVKIFEPFYRGSTVSESAIPGTGVGLAICRGLVEAHRGELTAYNRESGGAVFQITLPVNLEGQKVGNQN
jgi:two-component system, OmpR family, sensor histidine kinase KdpD